MKALSKLKAEEGIWMTDVPVPELGHNDLLIKIRKTAICGTDVHIVLTGMHQAIHADGGRPCELSVKWRRLVGQEVKGFKIGDRVASGEGHITCGHCRNCGGSGVPHQRTPSWCRC
ncbi:alcohol dehydrogenase catalytic domain-containing protein [Escherichia coli]